MIEVDETLFVQNSMAWFQGRTLLEDVTQLRAIAEQLIAQAFGLDESVES